VDFLGFHLEEQKWKVICPEKKRDLLKIRDCQLGNAKFSIFNPDIYKR
jgi:hypothetical protein